METVIKAIDNFNYLKLVSFKDFLQWDVKRYLSHKNFFNYPLIKISSFAKQYKCPVSLNDDTEYKRITVKLYGQGAILRDIEFGKNIKTKSQFLVKKGQFIFSKIDARNGAFGIISDELDNAIITNSFSVYDIDQCKVIPQYLMLITTTDYFTKLCEGVSKGTTGRRNITDEDFLNFEIPLPSITEQEEILAEYNAKMQEADNLTHKANEIQESILPIIRSYLGIEFLLWERKQGLHFTSLKEIKRWAVWNVNNYSLKKGFPKYTLEQLISISSGKFLPANKQEGDKYFVYGGNGINGTHNEYCFEGKRIIIGRVGEYCGNIHLVDGKYWVTDNAFWSERKKEIFTWEYLEVVLTGLDLNKFRVISAQPSISQSNILELEIPVPSFEEQNKIVEIVKEKRKEIDEIKKEAKFMKDQAIKAFEAKIFKN